MAASNGTSAARKLKSRLAAVTMRRLGLHYVSTDALTIQRKRIGNKSPSCPGADAQSATSLPEPD
jgi:hypothetical protein